MSLYNFDLVQVESRCISLVIKGDDGNPLNLSNYNTVRGGAKLKFSDNSYTFSLNPRIILPSGVSLNLSGYMTSGLPSSVYNYDVELAQTGISGDGNVLKALRGYINLFPETSAF